MELVNVIAEGKGGGEDVGVGNGPRIEDGTANLTIFLNFPSLSNSIETTLYGDFYFPA
jgi:hypothetical protein